ncbi:hypothetical protein HYC85_023383 [Camellia sinensis]|uniref:Uncharacterized protein n=1 Tax=Camellia sinensis TaxID=4442 RepID=A0A7J7GI77_CAMSI|nr:hypothetical protein HYC85_023383 [Camellia sinensis]
MFDYQEHLGGSCHCCGKRLEDENIMINNAMVLERLNWKGASERISRISDVVQMCDFEGKIYKCALFCLVEGFGNELEKEMKNVNEM